MKTNNPFAARDAARARLQELEQEKKAIIDASTAAQLERNRLETQELITKLQSLNQQCSAVENAIPPSARELELTEMIKANLQLQRSTTTPIGGNVPTRFIRADACEFFSKEIDEARERLDKLLQRWPSGPNVTAGGRMLDERKALEATIAGWAQIEPTCKIGEKLFALREEGQRLVAERQQMQDERRRKSVAA